MPEDPDREHVMSVKMPLPAAAMGALNDFAEAAYGLGCTVGVTEDGWTPVYRPLPEDKEGEDT